MFDISTKIIMIISGHLGLDVALILPDAALIDDLGADSLDTVELVIAFEEAFGIQISQDDAERIHTVNDAVEHVRSKVLQK